MPTFNQPLYGAVAAAITLPLLLLLYFLKLRRREMEVSSTLLWRKAIQDLQVNSPFQKLRRNLLLLLQMLLLAALLLAFARPVMNQTARPGQVSVIVIDRSASMSATDMPGGQTRLEEARRLAGELVDALPDGGRAMVLAFDDEPEVMQTFTTDRSRLRTAIDRIGPTQRGSHLKSALALAEAQTNFFYTDQNRANQNGPDLWIYSDGRLADRSELALKTGHVKKFEVLGSDKSLNMAITALSAKRNFERPNEVQVFTRLANFGPEVASCAVQLSIDGHLAPGGVKRGIKLPPERWTNDERDKAERADPTLVGGGVEFNLDVGRSAVIKVEIKEASGDVLAVDDTAQIVVPPPRELNVLLVSRGNLWLDKFLESANLRHPGHATGEEYVEKMKDPQALSRDYDVIIFDGYQPKALPPAGNFIYFNGVPPDTKIKAQVDEGGVEVALPEDTVLDWERNHPLLKGLNIRFYVRALQSLSLPIDAQVLIEGRKGPMLVLYREGRHAHLVMPFDLQETTWPTSSSFPVFMDNALQFLALGSEMDVRQSYHTGATIRIPRHALAAAGNQLKDLTVSGPGMDDVKAPIPDTGDFALPPLPRVGLYTIAPPPPQFDKIAVNLLDENESNICPDKTPPGGQAEEVGESSVTTGGARTQVELWWWLVAAGALPLLLIEWWVYTRRVHL